MKKLLLSSAVLLTAFCSCDSPAQQETTLSGLSAADFRTVIDGKQTDLFTLKNDSGMEVCLTNLGGRIVSVMVPDRDGKMRDVALGFDNIADYRDISNNFGATIGRYGNRIGGGKLTIDGQTYRLPQNDNGLHCLHGGNSGWDTKVFDAKRIDGQSIEFSGVSPDGDADFPGTVHFTVTVSLTPENAIDIRYSATTDKKTVINMTNHSYFNLSGDPSVPATDHILYIDADSYTPIDSTVIPTGEIVPVAGTPMDFTTPKAISRDIETDFEQLKNGNGYDHNWVLNTAGDDTRPAARLSSPASGITLEVYTSEPGLQVYTGNFLDGSITGKNGCTYNRRASVCLETQHFPDSPNRPQWPSTIVEPGQTYTSRCIYKFGVEP